MAIHDEITVGSLLVLADAGFDQRRIFHRRKAERDIFANALQRGLAHHPLAGSRVESVAACIIGHLEAAAIVAWDAVEETLAVVAPHRKMRVGEVGVAPRCTEEKNVLL